MNTQIYLLALASVLVKTCVLHSRNIIRDYIGWMAMAFNSLIWFTSLTYRGQRDPWLVRLFTFFVL